MRSSPLTLSCKVRTHGAVLLWQVNQTAHPSDSLTPVHIERDESPGQDGAPRRVVERATQRPSGVPVPIRLPLTWSKWIVGSYFTTCRPSVDAESWPTEASSA